MVQCRTTGRRGDLVHDRAAVTIFQFRAALAHRGIPRGSINVVLQSKITHDVLRLLSGLISSATRNITNHKELFILDRVVLVSDGKTSGPESGTKMFLEQG